ncbi:glycosyltransferase [Lactobacillus xujianguonis]|uniref:Glycosyltransferase n=1 Tax=Lactobacillus xujianguonis TaxID=2495899 RepID=A0A437SXS0_9LACO|nr:glycosyltransferase [Lactobacillus xujianguonis]RVU71670.1 glycosyltransferase [Lactobacillus xujianguonis]RVU77679.1 glycosyltransferase [Lactobacillus xujianguonis]
MHYFISTREDYDTSAIELAQVKRMQIFDALGQESQIVEIEKNDFSEESQTKLHTEGCVINIFQYFQQLPTSSKGDTEALLNEMLTKVGERDGNNALIAGKTIIQAHTYNDHLYYVDHLDRYGFTVKRQFFLHNYLNYVEYFDDQVHLMMREFMDVAENPVIREYFCQSTQKKPLLTMIELHRDGEEMRFDKLEDFQAFFLDQLAANDEQAVFYCDRCTQVLPAIKKMKQTVPSYVVFHSALTPSGKIDDQVYTVYQPVSEMVADGKLRGTISSTRKEAENVTKKLQVENSYAIPVTFIQKEEKVPFEQRKLGQIIAVARVDAVKQLSHLLQAIISLHQEHPELKLNIYGNNTDEPENKRLQKIVADHDAGDYIHFCGFEQDLTEVYNSAQLEVLTSKNEGFAMAILEAQAHGCPVVSYDINYGPSDIIADGKSGVLVPADNTNQLTQTIDHLFNNPWLLTEYSAGAYKHAQQFNFKHLQKKWAHFLKREKLV